MKTICEYCGSSFHAISQCDCASVFDTNKRSALKKARAAILGVIPEMDRLHELMKRNGATETPFKSMGDILRAGL